MKKGLKQSHARQKWHYDSHRYHSHNSGHMKEIKILSKVTLCISSQFFICFASISGIICFFPRSCGATFKAPDQRQWSSFKLVTYRGVPPPTLPPPNITFPTTSFLRHFRPNTSPSWSWLFQALLVFIKLKKKIKKKQACEQKWWEIFLLPLCSPSNTT